MEKMTEEDWNIYGSQPDRVNKKQIKKSDVFIAIITENWVKDPNTQKELATAKQNHVPVAAVVFDGIDEKPYLKDADVVLVRKYPKENSEACISEFVAELKAKIKNMNIGEHHV